MCRANSLKLETEVYESLQRFHASDNGAIEDIYAELMPFCIRVWSILFG